MRHEPEHTDGPARDGGTSAEPASVVLYPDGPYLLRGQFRVLSYEGEEIDPGRRTVALCRCGKSRSRPFCDGTHRLANFRAAGANEGPEPVRAAPARRRPRRPRPAPDTAVLQASAGAAAALIRLAHETLTAPVDDPGAPEERLALQLAEPMLRAACALIETVSFEPPEVAPAELGLGGPADARALIGSAIVVTDQLRSQTEDPLLETVAALLADASCELAAPGGRA